MVSYFTSYLSIFAYIIIIQLPKDRNILNLCILMKIQNLLNTQGYFFLVTLINSVYKLIQFYKLCINIDLSDITTEKSYYNTFDYNFFARLHSLKKFTVFTLLIIIRFAQVELFKKIQGPRLSLPEEIFVVYRPQFTVEKVTKPRRTVDYYYALL